MKELLYLVHRIPYPPNKGDKIRSYHLLEHLSKRYRIHLGAFIDDEQDEKYVDKVKAFCGETCFVRINSLTRRVRSLAGLLSNEPLSLPYYRDARLQAWVDAVLKAQPIESILVFSSAMAQYADRAESMFRVADFVDVDSDKWRQYGSRKSWPLNWLYRRESRLLLEYERRIVKDFDGVTFVSEAEAELFRKLAPELATKVSYFNNGVDADYFSPRIAHCNPYPEGTVALVFTGAMDYWANVDAVEWFARAVFPRIRKQLPLVKFYIVGARPTSRVMELAALHNVVVTGSVADVRPYLFHAALSVAPLRIARGVQNKVLEAMAMEKTVVASSQAVEGIRVIRGRELFVTDDVSDFADLVTGLLRSGPGAATGVAARTRILEDYSWTNSLKSADALLFPQQTDYINEEGFIEPEEQSRSAQEKVA
jgi:sugar transferase (PEP-CTERM/EpsH1 system associated)